MPEGLPCRLCLHDWPDQKTDGPRSHVDLFVRRSSDAPVLETFEVSLDLMHELQALPIAARGAIQLRVGNSAAYRAVRKADHRLVYWEFTGSIAPAAAGDHQAAGRGVLQELARGVLHGVLAPDAVEFYFDWQRPAVSAECQV